jgi:hypothetical protein
MKRWIPVVMLAVLPIAIDAQSAATPPSQEPAKAPAPPPDMSLKARFLSQYQYVRGNLVKMAEKMPAELYAYQPTPEIKTFAANMGHIIQSNAGQCASVTGRPNPFAGQNLEKTLVAKAEIVKAINDTFTFCDEFFTRMTNEQLSGATYEITPMRDGQKISLQVPYVSTASSFISHNNEMYGYMSVYMRLKGIVPPSSDRTDGR